MTSSSSAGSARPGLSPDQFEAAFPFHFVVDRTLVVRGIGRSLRKLCPRMDEGDPLTAHLSLKVPGGDLEFERLLQEESLFIWETPERQRLRGQMLYQPDLDACVFLGSPWIIKPGQLRRLGLFVQDFALHDPTVDMLQLMQSSNMALDDSHRLSVELKRQRTELRRANAELARFSLVASKAHNGVVITDANGFVEWVNPGFERITGWRLEEVVGQRPGSLLQGPETDPATVERIRQKLRQAVNFSEEILNYRKDGTKFWINLDITPTFDADGNVERFIAIENDISARREDQENLARTTTLLTTLIENFLGGVLVEDAERRIALANPAFCEIFQIPSAAHGLEGRPWAQIAPAVGLCVEDISNFVERLDTLRERRELCLGEEILLADGRVLERDSIPIFIDALWQGQLWVYRDVTWRRREERALRLARQQEAEVGFRIQDALLFGRPPADVSGFSVHAVTIPSQTIAGDFYDFFRLGPTIVDMVLGDVMGKGIPAALLGAAVKSQFLDAIMRLVLESGGVPRPQDVVQRVHEAVTPQLIALESFATVVYARVDLEKGEFTWVDCGHERTLLRRAADAECHPLEGFNLPFGFSNMEDYRQTSVPIGPGDLVVLYSDGVTEAASGGGEQYGHERLAAMVSAWRGQEPRRCLSSLLREVQDFVDAAHFQDDITCIALRVADASTPSPIASGPHLVVNSDLARLADIRAFVDEVCAPVGAGLDGAGWVDRLQIAVGEAASNICRHAYEGRCDGQVDVQAIIDDERVVIMLYDWGLPFTPSRIPEPDLKSEREGGLGLYLITQCVDQVRYERDGDGRNSIVLEKLRSRQEE